MKSSLWELWEISRILRKTKCNLASHISKMAPVDVAALLNTAEKGAKDKLKSTDVAKEVDPVLDLGNLLGSDLQPIDVREFM